MAFSYTEIMELPGLPEGIAMRTQPVLYYRPRSIVAAFDIETGEGEYVWGDHAYLGHVEMCPFDDNLIMLGDQSATNRQQETRVVNRRFTEDKQPFKVLAGNFPDYRGRTMDYIGHTFFTRDGFIGGQYVEMGGLDMRNNYTDRSEFNIVVRPDGTCKRKAKFPGHDKPAHVHCQRSDGLWVGDHWIRDDGTVERGWLSVIRNDFTCQELESFPLIRTNHCWRRPWHVHAWLGDNADIVICSYNTGAEDGNAFMGSAEDNHMALIEIPEKFRSKQ